MTKSVKRSKKKAIPTTQPTDPPQPWNEIQLEQLKLAQHLEDFIQNFQRKLLYLNFMPTQQELIVLFIMNLHPRWRRFVEPFELSFSHWTEAAAYAKHHSARISAILGCEPESESMIFKSPQSRTLRDSGYFSLDFSPSTLQDLLRSETELKEIDGLFSSPQDIPEPEGPPLPPKEEDEHDDRRMDKVPAEHRGVCLIFLDLPFGDKMARGLISKNRWRLSAISLEAIDRLGLEIKDSQLFDVLTDPGYPEAIGEISLPIHHPADPVNTTSELKVLVVTKLYNGLVDLVLGADFFLLFQPILNIQKRSIRFMDKETPYIVNKLPP